MAAPLDLEVPGELLDVHVPHVVAKAGELLALTADFIRANPEAAPAAADDVSYVAVLSALCLLDAARLDLADTMAVVAHLGAKVAVSAATAVVAGDERDVDIDKAHRVGGHLCAATIRGVVQLIENAGEGQASTVAVH